MCNKIGFIFFTLLITLLRLSEFIFIPQWSPMTEPIIQTTCYTYQKYKRWLMLAFYNIYYPIGELLLFFHTFTSDINCPLDQMHLIISDSLDNLVDDVPASLLELTCC